MVSGLSVWPPSTRSYGLPTGQNCTVHLWCAAGLCTRTHVVLYKTRDVPSESAPASSLQFADGIALTCARRTAQEVSDALSLAVTSLSSWPDARGLVLNAKKSNVLVFTSSSGQQPDVVVRCRNDVLPHTTSAKYLD